MFTGIIRHVTPISAFKPTASGAKLTLDLGPIASGVKFGDSIAVNGACLTVSSLSGSVAEFDIMQESLSVTTLGTLRTGTKVNLEPAMRLGETLDGHLVQGHVDGIATVRSVGHGESYPVEFTADPSLTQQMVPKGSVAINGVSLTLVNVQPNSFSVSLIPTTLGETNLCDLRPGQQVNIETDVLGKYILKFLQQLTSSGEASGGLTLDKLRQAGFI